MGRRRKILNTLDDFLIKLELISENFGKSRAKFKENCKNYWENFVKIYQYLLKLFSTTTWISSNYPTFLKFS